MRNRRGGSRHRCRRAGLGFDFRDDQIVANRCDVSLELRCPGAKPRRRTPPMPRV